MVQDNGPLAPPEHRDPGAKRRQRIAPPVRAGCYPHVRLWVWTYVFYGILTHPTGGPKGRQRIGPAVRPGYRPHHEIERRRCGTCAGPSGLNALIASTPRSRAGLFSAGASRLGLVDFRMFYENAAAPQTRWHVDNPDSMRSHPGWNTARMIVLTPVVARRSVHPQCQVCPGVRPHGRGYCLPPLRGSNPRRSVVRWFGCGYAAP